MAARTAAAVDYEALWRERDTIRLTALVSVGVFFMVVPQLSVQILGSLAVLTLLTWGTVRFARYATRFRTRHELGRGLVGVQLTLVLVVLLAISRLDALVLPTNVLLGLAFLSGAWSQATRSLSLRGTPRRSVGPLLLLVSAVVSLLLTIVAFSTAGRVEPFFVVQAGAYCVVSGMVGLLVTVRDAAAVRQRQDGVSR